jgi:uncharacterized protein YbgA (DUF1722 family)/uncharacterized protein YbbK (DUF523 family)
MTKPIILISKCIEFEKCRYNGDMVRSPIVEKLKEYCEFELVCPEMKIALKVPRHPIRLQKRSGRTELVQPASDIILTDKMKKFSEKFLSSLRGIDGAILKGRSPSCGIKDVKFYSEKNTELDRKHSGIFAETVIEKYQGYPVESEGRLLDGRIREHFLTKLFAFSSFRDIRNNMKISELIKYHESNKLLFMAYNQREMRIMGNMLGNQKKFIKEELFNAYFESMKRIMSKPITLGNNENALLHAFGYISKNMKKKETEFFMKTLYEYRSSIIPLDILMSLMKSYIARFEVCYLENQTYFNRHPVI